VIAAQVFVTLGVAPRNTRRCDQRAGKRLILVRQQQGSTRSIQDSFVARSTIQFLHATASSMPLVDKFLAMLRERGHQRLLKSCHRTVKTVPKCYANRELPASGEIDFADHSHITVLGPVEFPIQLEVLMKILPAIAMPDVAT